MKRKIVIWLAGILITGSSIAQEQDLVIIQGNKQDNKNVASVNWAGYLTSSFNDVPEGTRASDATSVPCIREGPKSNIKIIALEWVGGVTLSSLSWYLSTQLVPKEGWYGYNYSKVALIGLAELVLLGAPLGASIGTTMIGKSFDQHGSFWKCALVSLFVTGVAFGVTESPDLTGLSIIIGSSVGALIGYNLGDM